MDALSYWSKRLFGDWSSILPEQISLLQLRETLLHKPVLDKICPKLTIEEKVALRSALQIPVLRCPFSFIDPKDQRILTFPEISNTTMELYKSIKYGGSAAYLHSINWYHWYNRQPDIKSLIMLIKAGADVRRVSFSDFRLEGFEINHPNYPVKTFISYAVQKRSPELLEAILEADEDIKEGKYREETALIYNLTLPRDSATLPIARLLIKYGADPNAETIGGVSAETIYKAMNSAGVYLNSYQLGYHSVQNALFSQRVGADRLSELWKVEMREIKTVLMYAVDNNELEIVKLLIAAGANLDTREGITGTTALFRAWRNGNTEIVKALVEAGANPNIPSYFGMYPRVSEILT